MGASTSKFGGIMFEDEVEYMTEDLISNFRSGTIYFYIGSTFLNGYINYVKPIKIYLLERYRTQWKRYEEEIWLPFVNKINYNTNIGVLDDDVLILGKTNEHYYFFWFDCDVGDCAIGRQLKGETKEEDAIKWFKNYTESLIEKKFLEYRNKNRKKFDLSDDEECAEGISGYREVPTQCVKGWIKF
jgi:hypothetical protein